MGTSSYVAGHGEGDRVLCEVAGFLSNGDTAPELLRKADRYMYAAKRGDPLAKDERTCFAKI